jgi:DHA1 family multidrug resistance protein-like MFS transporter
MAADDPTDGVASPAARDPTGRTSTYVIAIAAGATSMSFNVWYPFMPLYALDLGAKSDADAVFWVALAITVQGVSRLASSAIWGLLSDRWGRKLMLLRALYLSSITFAFAAAAQAPWHLAIALGCQGFFSGFVPASVALVSVSVPDSRLNTSLSTVTGIQYLGTTIGPALGALLAVVFGFRGSIIVASLVPLIAATAVLVVVPRDQVARRRPQDGKGPQAALEPFRMSRQFVLAVAALFSIYSMNELIRLVTPIALKAIQGSDNVEGESGLAFTLAGLVSATSVLLIAPRLFRIGRVSRTLGGACAIGASGFLVLALTNAVPLYILGFLLVALVVSAMVPALNTLIAANVVRSRRGTGFGVAASVQALSFALGPLGAAFFAAVSLNLGFGLLAFLFFALGLVLFAAVREPQMVR